MVHMVKEKNKRDIDVNNSFPVKFMWLGQNQFTDLKQIALIRR